MTAILPIGDEKRISKERLRSETADLLHDAFHGVVKMVAAESGVSTSRIYRQTEGEDANYLELLYRQIERAHREGNRQEAVAVLGWLVGRFGFSLCAHLPVNGELGIVHAASRAIREAAEAGSRALDAIADDELSAAEAKGIARDGREAIEAMVALVAVAESTVKTSTD